ncbi:MAG TPA: M14 family zinc carboxypeptidase [Vicinamibacterales bacterium]|nr:M14 family zinc carboxypeptidase [Vicinamibacterales bacterium]
MRGSRPIAGAAIALTLAAIMASRPAAQSRPVQKQKIDADYTAKIKEYLQDPRITTELVDHLPASDTVPTPLKVLGHMPGTPGELTHNADINRYFDALAKASPRVSVWRIGKSEEGREMILAAIADESTIKNIDKYKAMIAQLTDPRKTTEEQARQLVKTAKPMYYFTSGMHSPETGGPEMLMELAYRLAVEETPFIQNIRNNVITLITPVVETDGRDKEVDTYYFNKKQPAGAPRLSLMYWGKYVQHDNNRDGMGQFLALTRNVEKANLEWKPTVLHDLHEAQTYLYASTGTGPYNEAVDPITVDEWWMLAENDVMEMTKRGVPGVWTYGFYDGWVPNYMFFIAHGHNAIGRFYEVQSYGPDPYTVTPGATTTSREWFRPNPPLPSIKWGPRNNTNIQESAALFALSHVAKNRELYLENYWLKNKRAVEKGKTGPIYAWVIPAAQYRRADAAQAVNDLRAQGLEVHRATAPFKAGTIDVKAGDYIVRGDQPYRTIADMYFSVQNYAPANPRPYDDTGWTFQYMRNLAIKPVPEAGKALLDQPMTLITADVQAPGGIAGTGPVIVVEHTTDNNLMKFRFANAKVKMQAAESDFDLNGRTLRAGAFIIPNADRAALEPMIKELGLTAYAVASAPDVHTHDLDVPRIGYVHSWSRTQDEGWVRAALDTYGVPYTYFGDVKLREGNLRQKYDVIVFPHVGGTAQSQVNGIPKIGNTPLPYKKTAEFPSLGVNDSSDDIRGGMGYEGLIELVKFVQQGGTLITEGSTSTILPEYNITTGVTVENPPRLFVRGSVLRGIFADKRSPLLYGYQGSEVPVYFNQDPVLAVSAGGFGGGRGFGGGNEIPGVGMNITPMASAPQQQTLATYDPDLGAEPENLTTRPSAGDIAAVRQGLAGGRGGRGGRGAGALAPAQGGGRGGPGAVSTAQAPRVVMEFPSNPNDMLLSGTLAGGESLANRAQLVDIPLGEGHVVSFAIRPFWRWQTQGTYFLAFNAILNWNDLDAGRAQAETASPAAGR